MSVSLLLMRPKDVHLLEGKDVECRQVFVGVNTLSVLCKLTRPIAVA